MNLLRAGVLLLLILAVFFAPDPDREYLFQRSAELLFQDILARTEGIIPGAVELRIDGAWDQASGPALSAMWIDLLEEAERAPDGEGPLLAVTLVGEPSGARAAWTLGDRVGEELRRSFAGWTSLLPPFLAIVAALLFQRTILALFLGVWLGSTLLSGGNPLAGLWTFFHTYLIQRAILDSFRMEIIGFVVGLVALVGIISRGGGVQGMIRAMMKFVRSRRSAQLPIRSWWAARCGPSPTASASPVRSFPIWSTRRRRR